MSLHFNELSFDEVFEIFSNCWQIRYLELLSKKQMAQFGQHFYALHSKI